LKTLAIPHRNRSPHGWWVASYLQRFEYYDEDRSNPNRRCLAWENTILIQAPNREQAYRKAVAAGRVGDRSEAWDADTKRKGCWRYEGVTSLLPIYEPLEDGSEIMWTEHTGRSVRTVQQLVKKKRALAAFDDRSEPRRPRKAG
jgi:hypothetical protein